VIPLFCVFTERRFYGFQQSHEAANALSMTYVKAALRFCAFNDSMQSASVLLHGNTEAARWIQTFSV
jgi:hypothetical protein